LKLKTQKEILKIIGDPKKVAQEMNAFKESAKILSNKDESLIKKYPNKWIAIVDGKVIESATTEEKLLAQLEKKGQKSINLIVRFISKTPRKLIL